MAPKAPTAIAKRMLQAVTHHAAPTTPITSPTSKLSEPLRSDGVLNDPFGIGAQTTTISVRYILCTGHRDRQLLGEHRLQTPYNIRIFQSTGYSRGASSISPMSSSSPCATSQASMTAG
ncbi:hypothetical protein OC844_005412 [Tilletia horrida]|nr:hypothetical protein OC844_005412 [Tilletia horrida]